MTSKLELLETPDLTAAATTLAEITESYYGHEIVGIEKIPSTGPALLVYYHGVFPVDYVGLVSRLYLRDSRLVHSVVHKFYPALPGWTALERNIKLTAAGRNDGIDILQREPTVTRDHYASLLEAGQLVGVAVGGAEEALFDWDYDLLWGQRKGFAKLALRTGAPIIPIFTENIREAFDTISVGGTLWKTIYGFTKDVIPWMPVLGGLPVKLTTFVGDRIEVKRGETPEELKERVEERMRELIAEHHVKGGGVVRALAERIVFFFKS